MKDEEPALKLTPAQLLKLSYQIGLRHCEEEAVLARAQRDPALAPTINLELLAPRGPVQ